MILLQLSRLGQRLFLQSAEVNDKKDKILEISRIGAEALLVELSSKQTYIWAQLEITREAV